MLVALFSHDFVFQSVLYSSNHTMDRSLHFKKTEDSSVFLKSELYFYLSVLVVVAFRGPNG